jgi:hypothetical protein
MILDTSFLQRVYQLGTVRQSVIQKTGYNQDTGKPYTAEELNIEYDIMGELPPHVQAHLTTEQERHVWGTLRPESLVTPPNELMLKHGVTIDGTWSAVAIKDADPIDDIDTVRPIADLIKKRFENGYPFINESIEISMRTRFMYGRPHNCYGVTLLAIFRDVG